MLALLKILRGSDDLRKSTTKEQTSLLKMSSTPTDSGFTIVEVLMVVIMVGVLSAIVAPSWLSFSNRQRLNKSNDLIYQAVKEAQSEAQKTKLPYTVSFENNNGIPRLSVHGEDDGPTTWSWKNITETENKLELILDDGDKIVFNYDGTVDETSPIQPEEADTEPGKVVIALSNVSGNSSKRCVSIRTLLGSLQTGQGSSCN